MDACTLKALTDANGVLTRLEFRILGPLEVADGDVVVPLGGARQRALLAILLLNANEVVSSDRLIDELWGERSPDSGRTALQVRVSQLRKALGRAGAALLTRPPGYVLELDPEQLDLHQFERLVGEADTADPATAAAKLREALALWRGEPLAELAYESFAQRVIGRMQELRVAAIEKRIDADLALGRHAELVAELEELAAEHPHREYLRGQLMVALYRCGRQADALDTYRRARSALTAELGLEPGPELEALQKAILNHDRALLADEPAVASPPRASSSSERIKTADRSRRVAWLLVAAAAVIGVAAVAAGIARLTNTGSTPLRVAPNSVAAIDIRNNAVVAAVPVGSGPGPISFGSGSLWVANGNDQTVWRIDPSTRRVLRTFSVGDSPDDIAATDSGTWVASSRNRATTMSVSRIDPQFNSVGPPTRIPVVVPGDSGPVAVADGAVWVAPTSGLLTRLDPASGRIIRRVNTNVTAAAAAIGEGAVWVVDGDANTVTRVDPTGLLTPIAVGNGPSSIAAGAGGVWVVDSLDDQVVRIDPNTRAVTATISVGRSPSNVAVGAGSIWVANSGDGTVTRINPQTETVTATIAVGASPQAIAFADGRAWVTVEARTASPGQEVSGSTVRVEQLFGPLAVDPAVAYDPTAWSILYATCVKLFNYPDASGAAGAQLTPEAAEAMPVPSARGRTYTFTIRTGFRFSPPSNQPVTAQTFESTIERALNPKMHAPLARDFTDIVGAQAYMSGRAQHISGVVARGDRLTIRLVTPQPDFLSRLALPIFCAIPADTPIDPRGVPVIPAAGPYHVTSYGQGHDTVLVRNPNYRGSRPHVFRRIELTTGISSQRAVTDIKAGHADYTSLQGAPLSALKQLQTQLAAQYGSRSPAATRGAQQYYAHVIPEDDFFVLNTHRPLFSDARLRQALNYAIDRRALASFGDGFAGPDLPADHYLPAGIPGSSNEHVYPVRPDVTKARALARGNGRTAVLYTCNYPACAPQAQIVKNELGKIGLRVVVRETSPNVIYSLAQKPVQPYDLALANWVPDYPDPAAMLNGLLDNPSFFPTFDDPRWRPRLAAVARLSGPDRYIAYGKLDLRLTRDAAPVLIFGNALSYDFFSRRVGCQTYGVYLGTDLAALCLRGSR
jgi:YVTN family beta-propeller protein